MLESLSFVLIDDFWESFALPPEVTKLPQLQAKLAYLRENPELLTTSPQDQVASHDDTQEDGEGEGVEVRGSTVGSGRGEDEELGPALGGRGGGGVARW